MNQTRLENALIKIGATISHEVDKKRGYIFTAKNNGKTVRWFRSGDGTEAVSVAQESGEYVNHDRVFEKISQVVRYLSE